MLYVGPTCWVFLTNKNVGTTKMLENVVCCMLVWGFRKLSSLLLPNYKAVY